MIRMQAPIPNRRGLYEIHDVPTRKIEQYKSRGWKVAEEAPTPPEQPADPMSVEGEVKINEFDLGNAPWPGVKSQIKELLGLDRMPRTKKEARSFLEQGGYVVR